MNLPFIRLGENDIGSFEQTLIEHQNHVLFPATQPGGAANGQWDR